MDARGQVLDAATYLFVNKGFAATSTREIADRVGIRQASLYYHFSGKGELLAAAMAKTIRPSLAAVDMIERGAIDPMVSLYVLTSLDVRTLAKAPHNSGLLGLMPDVAKEAPEYREERAQLANEYARISAQFTPAPIINDFRGRWGFQLVQMAEMVIPWVADETYNRYRSPDAIASASLRMCAVDEDHVESAKAVAHELLPDLIDELDL